MPDKKDKKQSEINFPVKDKSEKLNGVPATPELQTMEEEFTPGTEPAIDDQDEVECPDFLQLLKNPVLRDRLPDGFNVEVESEHLSTLWNENDTLKKYVFLQFIHAGGSGMVFKVEEPNTDYPEMALKVARHKLFHTQEENRATGLSPSPVSEDEINALRKIQHPNIVRLFSTIDHQNKTIGVATSFIDKPTPITLYLNSMLEQEMPNGPGVYSDERLKTVCDFLVDRLTEVTSALTHMHSLDIYHFDIKPENILISEDGVAILTDMGACVHAGNLRRDAPKRVNFDWTYAHPELQSIPNKPDDIGGQGLKASTNLPDDTRISKFDLFAFGRTIQEILAVLVKYFKERCFSSFGYKYLHLTACLMLDGKNAISGQNDRLVDRQGIRFVNDVALQYPLDFFKKMRFTTVPCVLNALQRYYQVNPFIDEIPELNPWTSEIVNTGSKTLAPFTPRVAKLMEHPIFKRLKDEYQLGWMKEVFPGGTHNRWAHCLGAFAATIDYYNHIISDYFIPTAKIILKKNDIENGLLAVLLHDIGQATFGHDIEEAMPGVFDHEDILPRLLREDHWGPHTLSQMINELWPGCSVGRIIKILKHKKLSIDERRSFKLQDRLAGSIADGMIDADKFDYVRRDSTHCSVPYGMGFDHQRFLKALSIDVIRENNDTYLDLAYKEKGRPSIQSLILTYCQMVGSIYRHHTFRCIQAMFVHAFVNIFGEISNRGFVYIQDIKMTKPKINNLIYHRLICGKSWNECAVKIRGNLLPRDFDENPPEIIKKERALELIWQYADNQSKNLLIRLAERNLYKRAYEISMMKVRDGQTVAAIKNHLTGTNRINIATELQELLINTIHAALQQQATHHQTKSDDVARERLQQLGALDIPLVILDFPTRDVMSERKFPSCIHDYSRKYIDHEAEISADQEFYESVKKQMNSTMFLRVLVAPELHELVMRYLPDQFIKDAIAASIPEIP